MQLKSISKLSQNPLILAIILGFILQVYSQSDCIAKSLPERIPLRLNESMVINLQDYFQGTNLTFQVQPDDKFSSLQQTFRCQTIDEQRLGCLVLSRYTYVNSQQLITILIQGDRNPSNFSLHIIDIKTHAISSFNLPNVDIANCSHFAMRFINSTHIRPTVNCKYTRQFWTDILFTAVVQINGSTAQWTAIKAPLFSYTEGISSRLQMGEDTLLRAVFCPSNSYVELWSWNDDAYELVSLIDKTFYGLDSLYFKDMQLHGNLLILLDYQSGLYLLRITAARKFQQVGSVAQPFYESFQYNPVTGVLYLAKKGKIVSINMRLQGGQSAGDSYNVYKYQHIYQIIPTDRTLIVLGQSNINLFRLNSANLDARHYQLFNAAQIVDAFPLNLPNQPFSVLLVKNQQPQINLITCQVKAPFLVLSAPEGAHTVTVTARSIVERRSSTCQQQFTIIRQTARGDFIYDNGYNADDEVLYANLPGEGVVELTKYGVGRNLQYRVITSENSRIDYEINIRKKVEVSCNIEQKFISGGETKLYLAKTWGKLLITQFDSDSTLRYYVCLSNPNINCYFGLDSIRLAPIDYISHETLDESANYTIVLQAILQQQHKIGYILVRMVTVDQKQKMVRVQDQCRITFTDYISEYANITQLQIINGRLFVVQPYRKQIRIYNLLDGDCPLLIVLNVQNCPWKYFAPRSIYFDRLQGLLRQQVIVIQQWDELLFVKLQGSGNRLRPVLLSTSFLPETTNTSILISYPYLFLFSKTNNRAWTYFIDDSHHLFFLRELPLSGRKLFSTSPIRNDYAKLLDENHVAVWLLDSKQDTVYATVFKFNQLVSAAQGYYEIKVPVEGQLVFIQGEESSEYGAIKLELITSAGSSYLLCKADYTHLSPSVVLKFKQARNFLQEYVQKVDLIVSSANDNRTHSFKVSISNVGNTIKRGSKFPPRGTAVQAQTQITIPDLRWFSGSIFDYQFDCNDCEQRIKFSKKVTLSEREELMVPRDYFLIEDDARVVKVVMGQWLVQMEQNYSVYPFDKHDQVGFGLKQAILLSGISDRCVDAKQMNNERLIVSLCWRLDVQEQRQYYLSVSSSVSMKGFVLQQKVVGVDGKDVRLLLKNELIVVYSSSQALLFTLWQVQGRLQFLLLQQIDQQDISSLICSAEIVTNVTNPDVPITDVLYSLILTECSSNFYYTSFSFYLEKDDYVDEAGKVVSFTVPNIHINNAQSINLIRLLSQKSIQLPSEAIIVQTICRNQYSPTLAEYRYSLLAVFDKFHTFQFGMRVNSDNGIILSLTLDSIYYKFGAYEAVSANNDEFMVIKYILDNGRGKLDEMYGFYDLNTYTNGSQQVKEHQIFEVYSLNAFHRGLQQNQEVPWLLKGHQIIQFNNQYLQRLNISNLLRARISGLTSDNPSDPYKQLYTQNIIITANNPNSARSASITLQAIDRVELTIAQILAIIFGSILVFIAIILLARFAYRKYDKAKKMVPLLDSTLAQEADLEQEEAERVSEWRINESVRGSVQP